MRHTFLTLVIAATCATAVAADFNQLPPGKWWENQRLVERIALSAAQQKEIAGLVYQHALKMIDLKAEVEKAELELKERADRETIDPDDIREAFVGFQASRQRLESERFEMLLSVRQVLDLEQWRELQSLRRAFERRRPALMGNEPRRRPESQGRGPERPMGR